MNILDNLNSLTIPVTSTNMLAALNEIAETASFTSDTLTDMNALTIPVCSTNFMKVMNEFAEALSLDSTTLTKMNALEIAVCGKNMMAVLNEIAEAVEAEPELLDLPTISLVQDELDQNYYQLQWDNEQPEGATIYYKIDSDEYQAIGTDQFIPIDHDCTLSYYGSCEGYNDTETYEQQMTYVEPDIPQLLDLPIITLSLDPNAFNFTLMLGEGEYVQLGDEGTPEGLVVYWTLDGSDPSSEDSQNRYNTVDNGNGMSYSENCTCKWWGIGDGYNPSEVYEQELEYDPDFDEDPEY